MQKRPADFIKNLVPTARQPLNMILELCYLINCSILISSCGGADIPPPVYNLKAEAQVGTIGPYNVVVCPNPGNDCASLYPYSYKVI